MARKILAAIAGVIAGFVVIFLIQLINNSLYPLPEGVDPFDLIMMESIMQNYPATALLIVLTAYILGAFVAGLITKLIDNSASMITAVVVGSILMGAGVANLFLITHPVWFVIASVLVYIPMAYLGGIVALKLKT